MSENAFRVVAVDPWGWRVPGDPAVATAGYVYGNKADAQARADVLNRRETEAYLTVRVWWRCPGCGGFGDITIRDADPDAVVADIVPTHICREAS